ncbi:hypothetical protein [Staphylococcus succinus]|uniref:hypothetical protein n=1 Tax=Staphylococcus succinus TaxID=61015 RepID=UPI002DBB6C3C|nr:hypothetical protein [Staphylococcus succinus]MEB8127015.1 hypothetical protein [Staphylococcus succinus]
MKENKLKKSRGRPSEWTDEQLIQLALDTKYRLHGEKLTPSLLERETKIGRNTWSRRMKGNIEELNNPIMTKVSPHDLNDSLLPSVDLILKRHDIDNNNLKNELIDLEILLYDMYNELKQLKENEQKYKKYIDDNKVLKEEKSKQEYRARHYEELYNNIILSSMYPHLQDIKESVINQSNIKEKLINMEINKDKNISIENLNSFFPDIPTDPPTFEKEERKRKNMKILLEDFDIEE